MAWELEQETEFLKQATGLENLAEATAVQMTLDTKANSVAFLGDRMPLLAELRLSNSVIGSLRDLGAALRHLAVLWVGRCELTSLEGLTGMPALRELYAPFNDVADLEPLQGLDGLEVLDLEANAVADPEMLYYLAGPPLARFSPFSCLFARFFPSRGRRRAQLRSRFARAGGRVRRRSVLFMSPRLRTPSFPPIAKVNKSSTRTATKK